MEPGHQFRTLPQNSHPINRSSLKWLKEAKEWANPSYLHVLNLAAWGLEHRVWPHPRKDAIEEQIGHLCRWKAEDAMGWLTDNPNGPDPKEQEADLFRQIQEAASPQRAAAHVLETIFDRMQAVIPSLQPAASELS